ncbi:hypothetical protein FB45DRAFT_1001587 [Roridomyces roridus]|uniref:Uncharacterized protein n=1 Tax=Roridomyces roridus TaxID=1738132 RepID=A0AAD7C1C5_9AGAR|nr:hypothetical protein FB45DRAFT_1001587 [Roridomyces roridus]
MPTSDGSNARFFNFHLAVFQPRPGNVINLLLARRDTSNTWSASCGSGNTLSKVSGDVMGATPSNWGLRVWRSRHGRLLIVFPLPQLEAFEPGPGSGKIHRHAVVEVVEREEWDEVSDVAALYRPRLQNDTLERGQGQACSNGGGEAQHAPSAVPGSRAELCEREIQGQQFAELSDVVDSGLSSPQDIQGRILESPRGIKDKKLPIMGGGRGVPPRAEKKSRAPVTRGPVNADFQRKTPHLGAQS